MGENCVFFWETAGMADVLALAHMRKKVILETLKS